MKKLFLILLISTFAAAVKAQTFAEWFKQKKTQKKYLIQQVAALQVYIGYLQKGYSIAKNGLNTISDIKSGEFNLHDQFFSSLRSINPNIRSYGMVTDIIALQYTIIQIYNRTYKHAKQSDVFNSDEIRYIYRVYGRLMDDCSATIDKLITVTTDEKLEMKDDERLKSIDAIYHDMQDKYSFTQSFSNQTMLLAKARMKENNEVETSRLISSIKN